MTDATEIILDLLKVESSDIVVDLGSGAGNFPIQAALTRGCRARGLELDGGRHFVAESYSTILDELLGELPPPKMTGTGSVNLRHGSISDSTHLQFITEADALWVNNAHAVFTNRADDSAGGGNAGLRHYIDDHVAALFAQCKVRNEEREGRRESPLFRAPFFVWCLVICFLLFGVISSH